MGAPSAAAAALHEELAGRLAALAALHAAHLVFVPGPNGELFVDRRPGAGHAAHRRPTGRRHVDDPGLDLGLARKSRLLEKPGR